MAKAGSPLDEVGDHRWMSIPYEPLINIFLYLNHKELVRCSQVCRWWNETADLDSIWKRRFCVDFKLGNDVSLLHSASSWKAEYRRITDLSPSVEFERIAEHTDEILHVSFSNNGMMFCTCSKDSTVKVFNADWPFNTLFNGDLGQTSQFRWMYTQFSQFSSSDTQLLVSGRCAGSALGGEIIIYNIFRGEFTLQARVRIMPYIVLGTWLNETHILSAKTHVILRRCLSEVLLNKSSQEIEDLTHSTVTRAFMFGCENFNTVSYLLVADLTKSIVNVQRSLNLGCFQGTLHEMHIKAFAQLHKPPVNSLNNSHATGSSQNVEDRFKSLSGAERPGNDSRKRKMEQEWEESDHSSLDSLDQASSSDLPPSVRRCKTEMDHESDSSNILSGSPSPNDTDDELDRDESESMENTTGDESSNFSMISLPYKFLLCFTGDRFPFPHQIGVKRITNEECTEVVRAGFDLSQLRQHYLHNNPPQNRPELQTDSWDHVLEMNGQVIGMALTPCNRYVFVNVKKWSNLDEWDGIQDPAPMSFDITMHMYDLISMKEVRRFSKQTATSNVLFLHISCNSHYVASGSKEKFGNLWDKHYGNLVSTFRHESDVNCVALNPRDPQMAVSVGCDGLIKIWRSKSFHRLLKGARPKSRSRMQS